MEPLPSYDDLIWLFEADPVGRYRPNDQSTGRDLDWRAQWPYTSLTFQSMRAGYTIQMDIATTMRYVHVHRTHVEDAWTAGHERAAYRLKGLLA